jgi:hypothetical protein
MSWLLRLHVIKLLQNLRHSHLFSMKFSSKFQNIVISVSLFFGALRAGKGGVS